MPHLQEAPRIGRAVAEAVAIAAVEAGLARLATTTEQAITCLDQATWTPSYRPLLAAV